MPLVMTRQFFTGIHDKGHLGAPWRCSDTALPYDNWRDLAACHFPKHQTLSKLIPNTLHIYGIFLFSPVIKNECWNRNLNRPRRFPLQVSWIHFPLITLKFDVVQSEPRINTKRYDFLKNWEECTWMDKPQVIELRTLLCLIVPKSFVRSTELRIPKA